MQAWNEVERSLVLAIVDASPDAMMVVDRGGLIHHANEQVAALFGYLPVDLVGRPVEVLMPERFRDLHRRHRSEFGVHPTPVIRPNVPGQDFFWGCTAAGLEIAVEVSRSPVDLTSGGFVLAAVRDMGERHRSEEHFLKPLDAVPDADAGARRGPDDPDRQPPGRGVVRLHRRRARGRSGVPARPRGRPWA